MSIFNRDAWDKLDIAVLILVAAGTVANIMMVWRLFSWVFDKIEQFWALF